MDMAEAIRIGFIEDVECAVKIMERDNPRIDMVCWSTCVVGYLSRRIEYRHLAENFRCAFSAPSHPMYKEAKALFGFTGVNFLLPNGWAWAKRARVWLAMNRRPQQEEVTLVT